MVVLNEKDTVDTSSQGMTSGQPQTGGGEDSMDKFNNLLTNVNKLLENDFVKQRLADKGNQQGQMPPQPQSQGRPQPQTQPIPEPMNEKAQENPAQPTPNKVGSGQENTGEIDLRDYFADKVKTPEGREELVEQIDGLTDYLDPEASLEQLQEEITSEEFVEQIEQLKSAGVI